jgi:multidrug resistance efflux pump
LHAGIAAQWRPFFASLLILFELDPALVRINLARAEANLAQARQNARQDGAEAAAARADRRDQLAL